VFFLLTVIQAGGDGIVCTGRGCEEAGPKGGRAPGGTEGPGGRDCGDLRGAGPMIQGSARISFGEGVGTGALPSEEGTGVDYIAVKFLFPGNKKERGGPGPGRKTKRGRPAPQKKFGIFTRSALKGLGGASASPSRFDLTGSFRRPPGRPPPIHCRFRKNRNGGWLF